MSDGTKTQTRRLLRNPEYFGCPTGDCPHVKQAECNAAMAKLTAKETGFAIGDRLYVRETIAYVGTFDPEFVLYRATYSDFRASYGFDLTSPENEVTWTPSIHMLREFSRLTLIVTDVRVERLQDISKADAIAEGIEPYSGIDPDCYGYRNYADADPFPRAWLSPVGSYRTLWNSLNGPGAWEANPWVVAVSFDVIRENIDRIAA